MITPMASGGVAVVMPVAGRGEDRLLDVIPVTCHLWLVTIEGNIAL